VFLGQGFPTKEDAKKAAVDELLSKLSASKNGLSFTEAEKRF
jgi:hypothetical protein